MAMIGRTWITNRIQKRQPKSGSFWCDCDRNRITQAGKWAKCGVCGRKCLKYKKIDRKPNIESNDIYNYNSINLDEL